MINCMKMDLYRMFRMKSFYVVGIILAAAVLFTTYMSVLDYNMMKEEYANNPQVSEQEISSDGEAINLGMDVTIPTRPGEMVTVYDQVYANLHGKFIAMFMVIFAVLFSSADMSSGYIKNIGGQMKNRGTLILSKAFALFIYTVLAMLFYLIIQTAMQAVCFSGISDRITEKPGCIFSHAAAPALRAAPYLHGGYCHYTQQIVQYDFLNFTMYECNGCFLQYGR